LICRVGSPIAGLLLPALRRAGRPYGLEVVGDPDQALAPGTVQHPLRPLFRWLGTRALQREVSRAAAVAYVTRDSLQKKYPASKSAFSTNYSSISLEADDFVAMPRVYAAREGAARLVFVGSLAQMYKGADVLLKAVQQLARIHEVELTVIGDGKHRSELEEMARSLSLENCVRFLGELPSGKSIRDQLERASLFVLPSRSEGLPRAMIEAMARALPCIGTRVGGIPELLGEDEMVVSGEASALAGKLQQVLNSPAMMTEMSARNLQRAQEYRPEPLAKRRDEFYCFLRNTTKQWMARQPGMTAEPVLPERISA
jgi:glycosyltransferase involved in cell wall biosynthesis